MDYSKSGGTKGPKGQPRHKEHNAPGGDKNPFGKRNDAKADLVRKLKEAAQKREEG
ncbi:hypothetical protein [Pseudoroseicyclus aestuarii]|uniref:Uncharacterized protein n=1 Tax=Pseudoroseicyclus aestuarii TaxID=1795041 RepID=A0A318SU78_9RHOB|nr:hypothetical protein [Pseudoroseicyclus aestuarii]PYE84915.1 hypothetical protein DFP88_102719 [Pseudoroseicyclus aestuarii]